MKCEGIFIFEVSKIFIRPVNKVFFLCYFKLFKSWKMIKFVFQIQYSRSPKKFQTCVMSYCMCVFKHLIPLCESRAGSVSENLIGSGALPVRWNDCQDCLISTVRSAEVKLLRMTTVQLIIPEKSKPFRWREDTTVKSGVARQVGKRQMHMNLYRRETWWRKWWNLSPRFFLLTTTEYQGVVVCMVSTVNLNSTILFNEDLIEEICVSTGPAATYCTFGISVNILSQYSKWEFKYF